MRTYPCPSCGASVTFHADTSLLAICEYCRSTLLRRDVDVEQLGKMAELLHDGSVLQLGVEGVYDGVHFAVVGRIQLKYPDGLWNEWYLVFDDMRTGWLGEARGHYAVSFETDVPDAIPDFEAISAGQTIELDGNQYEVSDVQSAKCIAGEGELPFEVGAGYEAPVGDLSGDGNTFASIDYSEETPRVFIGEYMEFADLRFSGLKEIQGWKR